MRPFVSAMQLHRLSFFLFMIPILHAFQSSQVNAHFIERVVTLSGPNGATGTGAVTLDLDEVLLTVHLDFANLSGTVTGAKLFAVPNANGTAIAALPSFIAFPTGVHSGTYDKIFDVKIVSDFDAPFVQAADKQLGQPAADALEALHDSLEAETAFIVIFSTAFPGGELAGSLTAVPESSSLVLAAIAVFIYGFVRWRDWRTVGILSMRC